MAGERRESTGRKKGEVVSKMPKVDFDMKAIGEVKKRKRGLYERWSKRYAYSR